MKHLRKAAFPNSGDKPQRQRLFDLLKQDSVQVVCEQHPNRESVSAGMARAWIDYAEHSLGYDAPAERLSDAMRSRKRPSQTRSWMAGIFG